MTGERFLILGKSGQLARALHRQLGGRATLLGREEVDLFDAHCTGRLDALVKGQRFAAVINAAAYTQVDRAENEGRIEAFRVNHEAVKELAQWCKAHGLPLVHFSTDYVFDGKSNAPYREEDAAHPLNAYGESKLAGEKALQAIGGQYLIFRTSWVYDEQGKNFFNTVLRLIEERDSLDIVSDQLGAPTYAPHLAAGAVAALKKALAMEEFPAGLYHLCAGGQTSWYGFAQAIFALATRRYSGEKSPIRCTQIRSIPTADYKALAQRPLNSRLDCSRAKKTFDVALPPWEAGLKKCMDEKYGRSGL